MSCAHNPQNSLWAMNYLHPASIFQMRKLGTQQLSDFLTAIQLKG